MNETLNILSELEQWIFDNHCHHAAADDEECNRGENICEHWEYPYVNSLELANKIRELKGKLK